MLSYRFWLLFFCLSVLHAKSTPPEWMIKQINQDLSTITTADLAPQTFPDEEKSDCMMRVRIKGGRVFVTPEKVDEFGRNQRKEVIRSFMIRVANEFDVPDCEFLVFLHDGVTTPVPCPMFCFSRKREIAKAILIPDPETIMYQKGLIEEVNRGIMKYPWNEKKEIAFWRGVTTGAIITAENYSTVPRFQLVRLSLDNPELIDARFNNFCQGAEKLLPQLEAYKGGHVRVENHLPYKYQILVDGNTAAWTRGFWQLISNCLMIKQTSEYLMWYYDALIPGVHYLPTAHDFSDLISVLQWAKGHDKECRNISLNAQKFAHQNLMPDDLLTYTYHLLVAYSKIQSPEQSPD